MACLPLGLHPRGLTREQAAEYCGCDSLSTFADWQRRGIVPGPIPGTTRWDKHAIDRALDRASGLVASSEASFDEWERAHAG